MSGLATRGLDGELLPPNEGYDELTHAADWLGRRRGELKRKKCLAAG